MTDSPSSSFMDGHGPVQTRDPRKMALGEIAAYAVLANESLVLNDIREAADFVGRIESLAAGLVQELTLLRDKEKGEGK